MASASCYNTLARSHGWTKDESEELRLCLMVYGIGHWQAIKADGHLPYKTTSQICAQTRRLLGQQSTAEFAGIRLDVNSVRMVNDTKFDEPRKNNLIISRSSTRLTSEELAERIALNEVKFGISTQAVQDASASLAEKVIDHRIEDVRACRVARRVMGEMIWGTGQAGSRSALLEDGALTLRKDPERLQSDEYRQVLLELKLRLQNVLERVQTSALPPRPTRRNRYPRDYEDVCRRKGWYSDPQQNKSH
mmetsp:Transcript_6878/g.14157  ORF Transcript_6878/g.14157 Transcript_6878/m.14157 type:complete len:249 (-) Transcript_6878:1244-1990(-)